EVAVRGVLVLADPGFSERRVGERGKALGEEAVGFGETAGGDAAVSRIGLEVGTVTIEGKFDAAGFDIGNAVGAARIGEVDPGGEGVRGEAAIAGRRGEEPDFLASGKDRELGK